MPVFNSRRFVAAAIRSILGQTFTDLELVIVDDGSTDGTSEILLQLAQQDRRIVLLRQTNAGVSAASNRGLAIARGEFIARMDHDDISLPHRLATQVEFLRTHPDCVAVGSHVLMIDREGLPLRVQRVPLTHEEIEADLMHLDRWAMFHPSMMARGDVMRELGGYSLEFCNLEDLDLFVKLAERGRLANLPEVLVQYRQHFSSICFTTAPEHARLREAIFREASRRRGRDLMPSLVGDPPPDDGAWARRRNQPAEFEKMWAWWALDSGFVTTARRHAAKAFAMRPFRLESWRLLACALRGR
jgi:glycosyltransferase involved in cell wall biosynthesis